MFFSFDTSKGETPASVARKRALVAQILGQIGNKSANNAGEGIGNALASIGQGISANVLNRRADKAEGQGTEGAGTLFNDLMGKIMGGGQSAPGAFPPAPMPAGGSSQTDYASGRVPQAHNPDASMISEGLVKRGMPKHVADAFVMNFKDESNLNPGINEANPIVPGSRGGFGLSQWTGPRRKALEAFAAQKGVAPSDAEMQLDFLMSELKGPEKAAAQAIMSAPDTGSAAAAIVNKFLRPAEEHRASREARYLRSGGGASMQPPMQMAQANTGAMSDAMPEMAGNAPQQPMQAPQGQPPQQNGAKLQMLMQAANSPWLNDQQRSMVNMMLKQEMEANDPGNMLDMEYKRAQISNLTSGRPSASSQFGNLDAQARAAGLTPGTPEYQSFMLNGGGAPATFRSLDMQAQAAGFTPGSPEYNEFMATRGAGLSAGAAQTAKNQADVATGAGAAAAKAEGQETGKALAGTRAEYESITSKMPGLYGVVGRLQSLAEDATYTSAGKLLDLGRKEMGMEPREAAVARAEYTAIVDNQILPLLRDTFGAQFTNEEGLRLTRTLGDADKSPTEKAALLRAFIEQKERDIQALGSRLNNAGPKQSAPQAPAGQSKRLKFNPETGELE